MGCTAGDLDNDGKPVIVFNNTMQGPSQFWKELPLYVYLGSRNGDYGVDHSAAVLIIDPNGEFSGLFSAPHVVANYLHDLPIIMGDQ